MDSATDNDLEVIRAQTRETRAQLAEKIEALESQASQMVAGVTSAVETVQQTVSGATEAVGQVVEKVQETVAGVGDTVSGTVEGVKQSLSDTVGMLDVRPAIQNNPWAAVGCAFAAGLAGGYLLGGPSSTGVAGMLGVGGASSVGTAGAALNNQGWSTQDQATGFATAHRHGSSGSSSSSSNGNASGGGSSQTSPALGAMGDTLSELGTSARSLGVSALMGLVTQLAKQAVPQAMQQDVCTALDKLKTRLGGHHNVNPETFLKS